MRLYMVSSAIALCLSSMAMAEEMAADAETIIVNGHHAGYVPVITSSATKTPTPLIDVPQAISVTTREQLDDQAMLSIADVVRYVPGITVGQGEGHRDQITLRGNNSTADFFVDGIRDDVQYYRGLYNVERVEVLKGPNAMIFGRGGGGGVINRVSKSPERASFVAGSVSANSFGAWYADVDVNQPLGEMAAARLNGVYEEFGSNRNFYNGHRIAINPTVAVVLETGTRIGLSYEYSEDQRVIDRGVPSLNGRPLTGYRDTFFGVPGVNSSDFRAHVARLQFEHPFSDQLSLSGKLLYGDYDKVYANAFAAAGVVAGQVAIEAYRDPTTRRNLFAQTDLVWKGATGGLDHVILIGAELGDQRTRNQRINGFFDGPVTTTSSKRRTLVALSDPLSVPSITFRAGTGNRSIASDAEVLGLYIQDQISLGAHFDIVGGVRYDRFTIRVDDLLTIPNVSAKRTDMMWSPRAGLIYKPFEAMSVYASYSQSFLPQAGDQFIALDATAAALAPEKFENIELGVKWNLHNNLSLTAAVYRLDRTNTRAPGAVSGTVVLTGAQRSKGLEIALTGEITRQWQMSAGYTLQKAEIRSTTSAAAAGREIGQVPRHQISLWNRYDLSPSFGIGLGAYHQSESYTSISNAVVLPAYTRIDAALFAKVNDRIDVQANIENLFDRSYFSTAHNDNNITPGAPLSVRFTVRARF